MLREVTNQMGNRESMSKGQTGSEIRKYETYLPTFGDQNTQSGNNNGAKVAHSKNVSTRVNSWGVASTFDNAGSKSSTLQPLQD